MASLLYYYINLKTETKIKKYMLKLLHLQFLFCFAVYMFTLSKLVLAYLFHLILIPSNLFLNLIGVFFTYF